MQVGDLVMSKNRYRGQFFVIKKKKTKKPKSRNLVAVAAFQRSGAGKHKDKRKESSRRACRKKVRP